MKKPRPEFTVFHARKIIKKLENKITQQTKRQDKAQAVIDQSKHELKIAKAYLRRLEK